MQAKIFETDWLSSRPVYYNPALNQASHNILDVIDLSNFAFDPEGFNNFLDFGYSVFQQTPLKDVRFLPPHTRLTLTPQGPHLETLPDPLEKLLDTRYSESDVIEMIRERVNAWEKRVQGPILLPLSGGYDSRLLAALVADKSRLRAYTYGTSPNQSESYEVVYARTLCQRLGIAWKQIQLGGFHRYFEDWYRLYGPATHAHGMYQIEFYRMVLEDFSGPLPLLSGIIGDAWAGSVHIGLIASPQELLRLGYSHGMHADPRASRLPAADTLREAYFEARREKLRDPRWRIVESMRFKLVLLSYIFGVPESLGFNPWSPYLDVEVAAAMLNLPQERREGRIWQVDFFRKAKIFLEDDEMISTRRNNLNMQAMHILPVQPLSETALSGLVDPRYVRQINARVRRVTPAWDAWYSIMNLPKIQRIFGMLRMNDRRLEAYFAYLTLWPFSRLLHDEGINDGN